MAMVEVDAEELRELYRVYELYEKRLEYSRSWYKKQQQKGRDLRGEIRGKLGLKN
ncbi:MAG: hypothetical protein OXU42_14630 [Deltaproteobacteria bacterium]|nr:hypothetical protein [Deltaproteobacteria bacterium]